MKKLLLLFSAILCFQAVDAAHLGGAEIWYEHDTLNNYKIHLKIYRSCVGLVVAPNYFIKVSSVSNIISYNKLLKLDTSYNVFGCQLTTCSNPSSIYPGFNVSYYSGDTTLPMSASDWNFSWFSGARTISSNLTNGNLYVEATLDNLNTPFNSTPSLTYDYGMLYSGGVQHSISLAAPELDGDSLDYRLTTPRASGSQLLSFLNPYTVNNPFPSTVTTLNSQTGLLTFTATLSGSYVCAIEVLEYRNGILISSSIRDYLFFFYGQSPANNLPNLSGINNTTIFTSSIAACPNAAINFTVNSSDIDPNDSTEIIVLSQPTAASFTTNIAQNQTGTFTWSPSVADVQSQPYLLVLEVRDNNCGVRHEVYQLFVSHCNTDSVWSGDANADFTCDNYDILNIGIANGATGPVRAAATTNWQAEWCANWTNNFISSINYKHADCNGDGTVDATDLAAVTANYGQIHTKTNHIGRYKTLGLPDLYSDVSSVQAYKGSTVSIPVILGSTSSLMNDFYGISATVELLNAQTSAPISITKNVSWIGTATNSFEFEKSLASNKTAFTFVRNDQQNLMAQQGQIGEITFPIDAASTIGSKVVVQFSNIKMIKNTGAEINDYNVLSDTMTILSPQSVHDIEKGFTANVYPNPTTSTMTIAMNLDKAQNCEIVLYDLVGRVVDANIFNGKIDAGEHQLNLDLSNKAQGHYLLEVKTESGKKIISVQKR